MRILDLRLIGEFGRWRTSRPDYTGHTGQPGSGSMGLCSWCTKASAFLKPPSNLRLLCCQELAKLIVASRRELGYTINLTGELGTSFEEFTSLLCFLGPDGPGLDSAFPPNASLSPSDIQRHDLMAQVHHACHRSPTGGFGISRMPAGNDHLWPVTRRFVSPDLTQARGDCSSHC